MKKFVLLMSLLFLAGCTLATTHITVTDPSHLRLLIRSESPYKVRFEGVRSEWKEPYGTIEFNAECAGTFEGVAHAYKVIGKTEAGEDVLFYIGEQKFRLRADGRGRVFYNGRQYDDVAVISSFYKYSNMPLGAEKTHYPFYTGPCGSIFLPDVQFQWGK